MSVFERWLPGHAKLWYDDAWYRAAWLVLPQAIAPSVIGGIWLLHPTEAGNVPWAKPAQDASPLDNTPPLAQPKDPLAACRSGNADARVAACTVALKSGELKGDAIALIAGGAAKILPAAIDEAQSDGPRPRPLFGAGAEPPTVSHCCPSQRKSVQRWPPKHDATDRCRGAHSARWSMPAYDQADGR
jgi:hypothetical protein